GAKAVKASAKAKNNNPGPKRLPVPLTAAFPPAHVRPAADDPCRHPPPAAPRPTEFMSGLEALWKCKEVTSVSPGAIDAGRSWLSLAAFRIPLQSGASCDTLGAV